jgi:outer membrane protein assembly factor BamB
MALVLSVGLAGCGGGFKNPFKKQKTPLPGERISIIPDATYKPSAKAGRVSVPPPHVNASWTQPGGDASNSLGDLSLDGQLRKLWAVNVGEGSSKRTGGLSAVPLYYGGRIYTLDAAGTVTCVQASSGAKVWSASTTPKGESSRVGYGGGLAIDGGYLFATTGYGTVVAFDANSGQVVWNQRTGEPIRSSPTASRGKVFFVSSDSEIHCLDAKTGKELWKKHGLPEPAALLSNVSPAVGRSIVLAPFPAGDLVAFDISNGKVKWTETLMGTRDTIASSVLADPARPVIDGGAIFAISHSGRMISSSESSGTRRWSQSIASTQMPWVAGSSVFVVDTEGKVLALSRRNGGVQWVTDLSGSARWSGPVLAGGKLWLVSGEGDLVSLDAHTGQKLSEINLDVPVYITPIVAGGRMYILTDDAQLIALG